MILAIILLSVTMKLTIIIMKITRPPSPASGPALRGGPLRLPADAGDREVRGPNSENTTTNNNNDDNDDTHNSIMIIIIMIIIVIMIMILMIIYY